MARPCSVLGPASIVSKRNRIVDKKDKKRLEVLRQKVEKTVKLLADAQAQTDEPDEVSKLRQQLSEYQTEISQLKQK